MIRQDFTTCANGLWKEKSHIWEVRHAGLLGIKYEVAVRSDVVEARATSEEVKAERNGTAETYYGTGPGTKTKGEGVGPEEGLDVKMEDIQARNGVKTGTLTEAGPQQVLQDVVDAAVLGQVWLLFQVHYLSIYGYLGLVTAMMMSVLSLRLV